MADLAVYGMTPADYNELLVAEMDQCPICLRGFGDGRPPCIDHSHGSGQVRGLLCSACNGTLGFLHDNAGWLRRAAEYLERPPADDLFDTPRLHRDAPPHSWRGRCWCGELHPEVT